MTKKIGDIAARIGTYQKDGQDRGRYVNLGTLFQGEDGSYFASLETHFDLLALHGKQRRDDHQRGRELRDTLNLTVFTEDGRAKPAGNAGGFADLAEDVPF